MDLFKTLGEALQPDNTLSQPITLTDAFRAQLKAIAESVNISINSLLNICTLDHLDEAIASHKHFKWCSPDDEYHMATMSLVGVTKDGNDWLLEFEDVNFTGDQYKLHDLDIQEVLAFMATIENVLVIKP